MTPRATLVAVALAFGLASAALFAHRRALHAELDTLATATDSAIVRTADARLAVEIDRVRLALERARTLDARTADPHLVFLIGDGLLTLERGDIVFRSTRAEADVPRGVHRVTAVEERAVRLDGGLTLLPAGAADTLPPAPGVVRVPRADFAAIRPNLKPGLAAFFY